VLIREDRGVVKLLACLPGACPRPTYVPENAVLAWVNRFDPLASYRALVEMVQMVNPGLGALVETQFRQIAVSAGLDLERDILARLGPDGFAAYLPPAKPAPEKDTVMGSLSGVSGCTSSDPGELATALQGILSSFSPPGGPGWETREVEGTTVHSAGLTTVPGTGDRFSYAVTSDLFLFSTGDPRALEAVLHAHAHPGKGLWGRSDLAGAFAAIPADACAIGYADLGALLRRPRDFGPVVGSASKTERGIFSVTRFLAPKP
jgi:hypothetical protein